MANNQEVGFKKIEDKIMKIKSSSLVVLVLILFALVAVVFAVYVEIGRKMVARSTSLAYLPVSVHAVREIITDGESLAYGGWAAKEGRDGMENRVRFELVERKGKLDQVLLLDSKEEILVDLSRERLESGGATNLVKEFPRWEKYYNEVKASLPAVKVEIEPEDDRSAKYVFVGKGQNSDYFLRGTNGEIHKFSEADFMFAPPATGEFTLGQAGKYLFPVVQGTNGGERFIPLGK